MDNTRKLMEMLLNNQEDPEERAKQEERMTRFPVCSTAADFFAGFGASERPGRVIRYSLRGITPSEVKKKQEIDLEYAGVDRPMKPPGSVLIETDLELPERSLWTPPPGWLMETTSYRGRKLAGPDQEVDEMTTSALLDKAGLWRSLLLAIGSVLAPIVAWLLFGVACWWIAEGRMIP